MTISKSILPLIAVLAFTTTTPAQDTALEAQKQAGQQPYMPVCSACHHPPGMALPGMSPPLANSDWVTAAKPDRLIRIVLHGMTGLININGNPFPPPPPVMPGQGTLSDEQIANIPPYTRTASGNTAPAVTPAEVAAIRAAEKARTGMWLEAELLKIPVE
ncbi:c-type cytochrome [Phragmitibacter flavus]|nr:cytochrome c [Phragmitibacter flavus]